MMPINDSVTMTSCTVWLSAGAGRGALKFYHYVRAVITQSSDASSARW